MAEDFTITFQGMDQVSEIIDGIKDKLEGLADDAAQQGDEGAAPEIIITSDQVEPEVEQILWDVLDKIKTRAIEDQAEFLLNVS